MRSAKIGGAEILVKDILNSNRDRNFSHFLLHSTNGPLLDQIPSSRSEQLIYTKFKSTYQFIHNLRRVIKEENFKIIHCHQPVDVFYAAAASAGLKVKLVRTYHGFADLKNKRVFGNLKIKAVILFNNLVVSRNFYVSEKVMDFYRSGRVKKESKFHKLLNNGIDLEKFNKKGKSCIREELELSERNILMGMVGSFNYPARDQWIVCVALKEIIRVLPDVRFIFIGRQDGKTPQAFEKCKNYCRENSLLDNVFFLGERNDITEVLSCLDLYVHSSNYETFGLSLAEAMASGVPCVASDIPAFREVTDNGANATLFEKGNAMDLEGKILSEIQNLKSTATKERIDRARDFVKNRFSMPTHLASLHKYYHECLV